MSLVTTELAPMTAPSPIDTPLSTHTFSPSQTFEPMETGAMERGLVLGSVEGWLDPYSPCPAVANEHLGGEEAPIADGDLLAAAMWTSSPIWQPLPKIIFFERSAFSPQRFCTASTARCEAFAEFDARFPSQTEGSADEGCFSVKQFCQNDGVGKIGGFGQGIIVIEKIHGVPRESLGRFRLAGNLCCRDRRS